jgi:hypothetical protein
VFENFVGDDDGRDAQVLDDVEDLGAEDVVVVLDDVDVTLVQQVDARADRCGRTVDELPDDRLARRLGTIGDANHSDV